MFKKNVVLTVKCFSWIYNGSEVALFCVYHHALGTILPCLAVGGVILDWPTVQFLCLSLSSPPVGGSVARSFWDFLYPSKNSKKIILQKVQNSYFSQEDIVVFSWPTEVSGQGISNWEKLCDRYISHTSTVHSTVWSKQKTGFGSHHTRRSHPSDMFQPHSAYW